MAHDNATDLDAQLSKLTTSERSITLPAETIHQILCHVPPEDLIHLRAVSKLFDAILRDAAIWRTLYTTAPLPLPPGPFSWQSTHVLQRALIRSSRLSRVWTADPLALVSRQDFRTAEGDTCKWVCGRWLIESKDLRQLRVRDVETGEEQVLWDRGTFAFWAVTSVMNTLGHFIYLLVHLQRGRLTDPVQLVEFAVDDETGRFASPEVLDVPFSVLMKEEFVPRVRLVAGMAPYVYVSLCSAFKPRQSLVFDPYRRRFFKFPRFRTRLDLLLNYRGGWLPHLVEVYLTRTHIFILNRSYLIHGGFGNVEVIQTFTLPEDDDDATAASQTQTVRDLRLTHECLSHDTGSLWLTPIRNAVVDPATGVTTLRFMHAYTPFEHNPQTYVDLVCTDYILPPAPAPSPARRTTTRTADAKCRRKNRNSTGKNANASTNDDDEDSDGDNGRITNPIETRTKDSIGVIIRSADDIAVIDPVSHVIFSTRGVWSGNLVDASYDGFVRGLCMVSHYSPGSHIPDRPRVHKFAVDATGPTCVAVVGEACPPWKDLNTSRTYEYSLDGVQGKMWRTKGETVDKEEFATVLDFK